MNHADFSEFTIIASGALIYGALLRREYLSIQDVSNNSALANTARETVLRALVISFKVKIVSFIETDKAALNDYRRFRRMVDLLTFLAVINVFMLCLICVGLFMIFRQNDFENYVRSQDLFLVLGFICTFVVAYGATDRLRDTLRERQLNPALIRRAREQPPELQASRTLEPQGDTMRKVKVLKKQEYKALPPMQPVTVYPALTASELASLKDDTEAVKRDLIAAGILDENGQVRDVYKRT